jgi:hypothetical protein
MSARIMARACEPDHRIYRWRCAGALGILGAVSLRIPAFVVLAVSLVGCVGARPWEREHLAKRKMQFDDDVQAVSLEQHVYSYREGSTGGYGSSGGGCGCN